MFEELIFSDFMIRSFTILNTFNNYSIIMTNISNNILQIQIFLQFYLKAEKGTKIKFVIVIVKSSPKSHHLLNLRIFVTILFFLD